MAEYIEREVAIKLIAEDRVELTPMHLAIGNAVGGYTIEQVFDSINQACDRHIEIIKSVPFADVQPVEYGEWTAEGNDEIGNYWDECTVCRKAVWFPPFVKNDYKYCPHCGAKTDGEYNA